MVGWKNQGSALTSKMPMRKARGFKMRNGKHAGCPFWFIAQTDPGYILWLRVSGHGEAKEAATALGKYAEKIKAELEELVHNPSGGFNIGELPF